MEQVKKVLKAIVISPQQGAACATIWCAVWATKEQCRRPSVNFCPQVAGELKSCFDKVPRLNAYEIRQHLKRVFNGLGPNVLRISQRSGWVTGEVKRRKERLIKAAAGDTLPKGAQAESAETREQKKQRVAIEKVDARERKAAERTVAKEHKTAE